MSLGWSRWAVAFRSTVITTKSPLALAECPAKCRWTVKLTRYAAEALGEHLTRQLEGIDGMGDYYRGLVFATMKGRVLNPTNLRKRSFPQLLVRADLPNQTFHQLRHTAAAILLHENVNPRIVSEMLDHASTAITPDKYSHVLPNMQDSAVAAMEEAFAWRVGVVIGVKALALRTGGISFPRYFR